MDGTPTCGRGRSGRGWSCGKDVALTCMDGDCPRKGTHEPDDLLSWCPLGVDFCGRKGREEYLVHLNFKP